MTFANAAAGFVVVPIDDVMAAVFDAPVFTVVAKDLRGAGEVRRFTGDAIGEVAALFRGFLVEGDTFHHEGLPDMWKVQVVIQGVGHPDIADFDAPMLGAVHGAVVGLARQVVKIPGGIFEQVLLVALDYIESFNLSIRKVAGKLNVSPATLPSDQRRQQSDAGDGAEVVEDPGSFSGELACDAGRLVGCKEVRESRRCRET